jgi:hypothetical protein
MAKAKAVSLTKGVALNPPPPHLFRDISESVDKFAQTLKADEHGGFVGIATTKGMNIAVVQRINQHSTVVAYVGKSWGEPIEGGLMWKLTWT